MSKSIKQSKIVKTKLKRLGYNPKALKKNDKNYKHQLLLVQIIQTEKTIDKIIKSKL